MSSFCFKALILYLIIFVINSSQYSNKQFKRFRQQHSHITNTEHYATDALTSTLSPSDPQSKMSKFRKRHAHLHSRHSQNEDDAPIPTVSPTLPTWIDTVHLVISNHFDCGFAGIDPQLGYAVDVVNKYFDVYFPMAISNGKQLAQDPYNLPFTWMTQSWLISLYFDCPLNMGLHCPNQTMKDYIQYGIDQRYIYWHGFPFNSQMEVYDKSMLEFGLKLSSDLSKQYGAPLSTIISQRDVPMMTRSMIPILTENNITAISVGVNMGSSPPDVPRIFKWKDSQSNTSMITMVNPGGYGGV